MNYDSLLLILCEEIIILIFHPTISEKLDHPYIKFIRAYSATLNIYLLLNNYIMNEEIKIKEINWHINAFAKKKKKLNRCQIQFLF